MVSVFSLSFDFFFFFLRFVTPFNEAPPVVTRVRMEGSMRWRSRRALQREFTANRHVSSIFECVGRNDWHHINGFPRLAPKASRPRLTLMAQTALQRAIVPLPTTTAHDRATFEALPEALLFLIALKLDSARDLCSLEAVNRFCRYVTYHS